MVEGPIITTEKGTSPSKGEGLTVPLEKCCQQQNQAKLVTAA